MQQLTPRQRDIVCRLGLSNKQIARDMGISLGTVKNHLTQIYIRLGCYGVGTPRQKRVEALLRALRHGYVRSDEVMQDRRFE